MQKEHTNLDNKRRMAGQISMNLNANRRTPMFRFFVRKWREGVKAKKVWLRTHPKASHQGL